MFSRQSYNPLNFKKILAAFFFLSKMILNIYPKWWFEYWNYFSPKINACGWNSSSMNVENFFRNATINMFFKDAIGVNYHVKALKTAVEIEKMEHCSDLLHNIFLFAVLLKEKPKFKQHLTIFCPHCCMSGTKIPQSK